MQIEQGLMTYLLGQTALMAAVGNRINFVQARTEWNGASPYLVFQKISAPRLHSHDGAGSMADARFQFTIIATDYNLIKPVAALLQTALDGYAGTMGGTSGVVVYACFYDDETDLDPGDSGLYGVACDYIITHKE